MKELVKKQCTACAISTSSLKGDELKPLYMQLGEGWDIAEEHHLYKLYTFPDFKGALALVNIIGRIAEEEGHHPEINLGWGKVGVKIWTHKVDGLTEADFILAAKIETEFISHEG